jgi:c-di-GMP-binding flagellar brake protein YcgR
MKMLGGDNQEVEWRNMEERRKYPRFKISHDILYGDASISESTRNEGKSITEDVSRGGIKVKIKNSVAKGKKINVKIFNREFKEPVDAEVEVVWNENHDTDSLLGLAFTKIGWVESDRLFLPEVSRRVR